jgi:hypothetical protein
VPALLEIVLEYCVRQLVPSQAELSCTHMHIGLQKKVLHSQLQNVGRCGSSLS